MINLVNESTKSIDTKSLVAPLQQFVNLVTVPWDVAKTAVNQSSARILDGKTFNVCIVDKFPNPALQKSAYGYHEFVNGQPIAYIRADSFGSRNPAGDFLKQLSLFGKVIRPAKAIAPGIFSVICHEVAEALLDPQVNVTKTDARGQQWIMEICDHTVGMFLITAGITVVAPDFTLPNFYRLGAPAPYSYMGVPTAPFTLPKGAYGYDEVNGKPTPLTASSEELDHQ